VASRQRPPRSRVPSLCQRNRSYHHIIPRGASAYTPRSPACLAESLHQRIPLPLSALPRGASASTPLSLACLAESLHQRIPLRLSALKAHSDTITSQWCTCSSRPWQPSLRPAGHGHGLCSARIIHPLFVPVAKKAQKLQCFFDSPWLAQIVHASSRRSGHWLATGKSGGVFLELVISSVARTARVCSDSRNAKRCWWRRWRCFSHRTGRSMPTRSMGWRCVRELHSVTAYTHLSSLLVIAHACLARHPNCKSLKETHVLNVSFLFFTSPRFFVACWFTRRDARQRVNVARCTAEG
jgi:hypothetical protein